MPPCRCVANSVKLVVEYRKIFATGVDIGFMVLSEILACSVLASVSKEKKERAPLAACQLFFAYVEQKGVFFHRGGNSPVQPLAV
jgi:hypothetical protein